MDFGFGIGDAIAVTQIIIKTYKAYKDTPKEILQIKEHVKGTWESLVFLGETIGQPGSLIHTRAEGMHVTQVHTSS